jgi:RNA polymerase sigma factor (sigma-70 family)
VLQEILASLGATVFWSLKRQFGRTLNDADLEDVISITLFRIWKYHARYDPSLGRFMTWGYAIARKAALDAFQRKLRESTSSLDKLSESGIHPAIPDESHFSDVGSPQSAATLSAETIALNKLLSKLSEQDRAIILAAANALPGDPWAMRLASELELSAGAIRVRRHRIIERLKKSLLPPQTAPASSETA